MAVEALSFLLTPADPVPRTRRWQPGLARRRLHSATPPIPLGNGESRKRSSKGSPIGVSGSPHHPLPGWRSRVSGGNSDGEAACASQINRPFCAGADLALMELGIHKTKASCGPLVSSLPCLEAGKGRASDSSPSDKGGMQG